MASKGRAENLRKMALGDIKNHISTPIGTGSNKANRPLFYTPMAVKKDIQKGLDDFDAFGVPFERVEQPSNCSNINGFEKFLEKLTYDFDKDCPSPSPPPTSTNEPLSPEYTYAPSSPEYAPEFEIPEYLESDDDGYFEEPVVLVVNASSDMNHSIFSLDSSFERDVPQYKPMFF